MGSVCLLIFSDDVVCVYSTAHKEWLLCFKPLFALHSQLLMTMAQVGNIIHA